MPATTASRRTNRKKIPTAKNPGKTIRVDDAHQMYSADVEISKIDVVENDRQEFNEVDLQELTTSIKQNGLMTPLLVRAGSKEGRFDLIAGERRLRAARKLKLKMVPIRISNATSDLQVAEQRLDENIRRVDLNPIEKAIAIRGLLDKGRTQKQVAAYLSCTQAQVSNQVRLLELPDPWRGYVISGRLAPTEARKLLPYCKPERTVVLEQLWKTDSDGYENDPDGIKIEDWDLRQAIEKATRSVTKPMGLSWRNAKKDDCLFAYDEKQHKKLLEVDSNGRAWNVEEWENLNADPMKKQRAKEKKRAAANKSTTSGSSGPTRIYIDDILGLQLGAEIAEKLTAKHRPHLLPVFVFLLQCEAYDLPWVLLKDSKRRTSVELLKIIKTWTTKNAAANALEALKAYLSDNEYCPLEISVGIAEILGIELWKNFVPSQRLLEKYPPKMLRDNVAKCIKGIKLPADNDALVMYCLENWIPGKLLPEIAKVKKDALK